jgi:hypothetical protein
MVAAGARIWAGRVTSMNVGPIHWGSYGGEFLETVMAVLVAQDCPDTLRRTPARGDGGVDLMIPEDGGYVVYQVKSFTGRLGGPQRRQVQKSWEIFREDPRLNRPVRAWYLVAPIDLTDSEHAWFEELTAGAPFPTGWRGEVYWNKLAADHPQVIDYYMTGGRDRIAQRSHALMAGTADPTRPLTAADVAASLEIMRTALSREDPHYSYEFVTSAAPLVPESLPRCVLSETRKLSDGGFLTICVVPKHRYSDRDAPIKGSLEIQIADPAAAVEFQKAFDGFSKFGRALDIPEGSLSASLEAPGGLGGSMEGGSGRIGPMLVSNPPKRWRVVVIHPKDGVAAAVPMHTESLTGGHLGGAELSVHDPSESLQLRIQVSPPDASGGHELQFQFTWTSLAGKPVLDVLQVARILALLRPPYELQWRAEHGNASLAQRAFEKDYSAIPDAVLRLIEDLGTLQERAPGVVRVPEDIDPSFAAELHGYARMLRGEVLTGTWDEVTLNLKPNVDRGDVVARLQGEGALGMQEDQWVEFDDQQIDLGTFTTILASIRVAEEQDPDEGTIRLESGHDNSFTRRVGPLAAEDPTPAE